MKKLWLICILLLPFAKILAQEKFVIAGTVTDENEEPLIGATVHLVETFQGNITNLNGHYQIPEVLPGQYHLVISVIGYESDTIAIEVVEEDLTIPAQLKVQVMALQDVEVVVDRIIERTSISNISFGKKALQTSQGLTEDPLRTLSALPGVGRDGDLFSPSQIYVRGGAPEENLFLIDNNKVYFPYYFGGQKSIFNTETTESIELLTGGFSAAYGNHMSSVMNVKTRDGSFINPGGHISLGFYNASALFEGPIKKERSSVLVAFRRTYLDLFLDESAEFPVPYFGDVTYQISAILNENNKLSFSGLSSEEAIDFIAADPEPGLPDRLDTEGKNHFQSLQLQTAFRSNCYNKLSVTNTLNRNTSQVGNNLFLDIDAWQMGFRDDFTCFLTNRHTLKAGLAWQYGTFDFNGNLPLDPLQTDLNDTTIVLRNLDIHEEGEIIRSAYLLYDGSPIKRIGINVGLRLDQNPGNKYTDLSPRFSVNYQLAEQSKIRFSTGLYHQFPGSEGGSDLVSSLAVHYILGYEYRFSNSIYGWIEGYYKDYEDLVYYDEMLNYSNEGHGSVRGVELLIRKERGNLRGWISYALSHSERRIPLLDKIRDFEFDQRHIFNLVAEYHIPRGEKQWYIPALVQMNFRYADGRPYTPVTGAVNDGTGWTAVRGEPLSLRNTDYHNLNVRVEYRYSETKRIRISSFFEGWNLINARNILGRAYRYGSEYPNNVKEQPYYTTPILMGGGFRVEFGGE